MGTHMYMDFFKVSLYMNYFFFVKCRSTFLFTCCRVAHGIDTVYLTSPLWMDMNICISIRVNLQATNRIRTRNVELLMLLGSFSFVLSPHQRSGSRVWVRELFTFLQTNKTQWCSHTILSSPKIVTWFGKSLQINKDYKNLCELSTLK